MKLLYLFILFFSFQFSAQADQCLKLIISGNANLRTGPGTGNRVCASAGSQDFLTLEGSCQGRWCPIFNNACGGRAWVHKSLTTQTACPESTTTSSPADALAEYTQPNGVYTAPELSFGDEISNTELSSATFNPDDFIARQSEALQHTPPSYFRRNGSVDRNAISEYQSLFNRLSSHPDLQRSKKALARALAFYARNKNGIPAECGGDMSGGTEIKSDWISVTDYTLPHTEKRMFLINTKTGQVVATAAAHGYGSNTNCPESQRFRCTNSRGQRVTKCKIPSSLSNIDGSGQTSRGFFLTNGRYPSEQSTFRNGTPAYRGGGNAIYMHGLQGGVNNLALSRHVVFHRANYVSCESVNICSSSAGCPSICPEHFEDYKEALTDQALMYLHTQEDEQRNQPDC